LLSIRFGYSPSRGAAQAARTNERAIDVIVNVASFAFRPRFMLPEISDHVIGILGAIIGAIGIIASVYVYYRSKQRAAPCYVLRDEVLLDPSAPGTDTFDIFFSNEPVRRAVRKATLAIWNAGNMPIKQSDVAQLDPPRLTFPDGSRIFTHEVSSPARRANGLNTVLNGSDVLLTFDFLDQGDGGVIEVTYEGDVRPEFKGTISGVPEGFKSAPALTLGEVRSSPLRDILPIWAWLIILPLMIAGVVVNFVTFFQSCMKLPTVLQAALLLGVIAVVWLGRRRVRQAIPSNVREALVTGET
jgi:hypothetical protein